jgi:hypothetical protein
MSHPAHQSSTDDGWTNADGAEISAVPAWHHGETPVAAVRRLWVKSSHEL